LCECLCFFIYFTEKLTAIFDAPLRYRGLKHPLSEVSNEYTVGNTVYLHSVTSTTTDDQTALRKFGRPDSAQPTGAAGTYLKLYVKSAKCIEALSKKPHEQEYMINFNAKFRVSCAARAAVH
jgi:hypothetical protein